MHAPGHEALRSSGRNTVRPADYWHVRGRDRECRSERAGSKGRASRGLRNSPESGAWLLNMPDSFGALPSRWAVDNGATVWQARGLGFNRGGGWLDPTLTGACLSEPGLRQVGSPRPGFWRPCSGNLQTPSQGKQLNSYFVYDTNHPELGRLNTQEDGPGFLRLCKGCRMNETLSQKQNKAQLIFSLP